MSHLLGTPQEKITSAVKYLEAIKIIKYQNGLINIIDSKKLQNKSCDCSQVLINEIERMFDFSLKANNSSNEKLIH